MMKVSPLLTAFWSCFATSILAQPFSLPLDSARPNDPYYKYQWNLENVDTNGVRHGVDLNVRAAWSRSTGSGVTIAIVDDGVDLEHPDLLQPTTGAPHFNFQTGKPEGNHPSVSQLHGTAVAGLAAAQANNNVGISGVAPGARLASWVIYATNSSGVTGFVNSTQLARMFQYKNDTVAVQNHSWVKPTVALAAPGDAEKDAIFLATSAGRQGKGVVMVRAAGNSRLDARNANDDGYVNSPLAIAVAAARSDGRAASYSNVGACLLVAAPSGDLTAGYPNLFTTDRRGSLGYNGISFDNDLADYVFDGLGFNGTSAAAPEISGVVALMLSANPRLTLRDVQQVLIHASSHWDLADPDVQANGAGYRVSHNLGFGIPDVARAVQLAEVWSNQPPAIIVTYLSTNQVPIPDAGLRVEFVSTNSSLVRTSFVCLPSLGPHVRDATELLPMVDVGVGSDITVDLHGKGALMERGAIPFAVKLVNAANAGAAFAIVYNYENGTELRVMGQTDFVPIPAVFIGQNDGETLHRLAGNETLSARISAQSALYEFAVTETLRCEHVGLRVRSTHPRRGDLRITLTSPSGHQSVLQALNSDTAAGPVDWTYYSVHHFYESSFGTWKVNVVDELAGNTGSILETQLIISGVPITDADHDGLDDAWELAALKTLSYGPADDPDRDGYSNAAEQVLHTDPLSPTSRTTLALSRWSPNLLRLTWPNRSASSHQLWGSDTANGPYQLLSTVGSSRFSAEAFVPADSSLSKFFYIISR